MVADAAARERVAREEVIGSALAQRMDLVHKHDPWEWSRLAEGKRRTLAQWAGETDATKKQALLEIAAIWQTLMDADRGENALHRQDLATWHHIAEKVEQETP